MAIGNRKKQSISLCYAILALMYLGFLLVLIMLVPRVENISQFFDYVSLLSPKIILMIIAMVVANSALAILVWQLPAAGKEKKRVTSLLAIALALVAFVNAVLGMWALWHGMVADFARATVWLSLVIALIYMYQAFGVFFIIRDIVRSCPEQAKSLAFSLEQNKKCR